MRKILLFILASLFFNSCIEITPNCHREYKFKYPVQIYPAMDTFNIGDTIWVEINIDNMITDELTEERVDISELELEFTIGNTRYDLGYYNNSASDFDFHLLEGEFGLSSTRGYVNFNENSDKKFKVAMIPKVSGGQVISVNPRPRDPHDKIELGSECIETLSNDSYVVINNNIGNNVEVLKDLYITIEGETFNWITEGLTVEDVTNTYVFYVR